MNDSVTAKSGANHSHDYPGVEHIAHRLKATTFRWTSLPIPQLALRARHVHSHSTSMSPHIASLPHSQPMSGSMGRLSSCLITRVYAQTAGHGPHLDAARGNS